MQSGLTTRRWTDPQFSTSEMNEHSPRLFESVKSNQSHENDAYGQGCRGPKASRPYPPFVGWLISLCTGQAVVPHGN